MAFHRDLVRQGEWLFRRRSFVPAILLAPVVATVLWTVRLSVVLVNSVSVLVYGVGALILFILIMESLVGTLRRLCVLFSVSCILGFQ